MNHPQAKNLSDSFPENGGDRGSSLESLALRTLANPNETPFEAQGVGRDETGIYPTRRIGLRGETLEKLREISELARNSFIVNGGMKSSQCSLKRLGSLCSNIKTFLVNKKGLIKKFLKYVVWISVFSCWSSGPLFKLESGF